MDSLIFYKLILYVIIYVIWFMCGDNMGYILNKDIDGTDVTVRRLQNVLKEMVKDFDAICKKNSIEYTLFSGTALGAVRHQGFIPWDDDLDVAIMRQQYEQLIVALEKDLPEKYIFQCFEKDQRYLAPYPAIKIRLKNTYIEEKNVLLKNKCSDSTGIFIDVFLLNYVSEDKKIDRQWRLKNLWLSFLITFLENLDINPVRLKKKFIQNAVDYGKENEQSDFIGDEITWVYRSVKKPYIYLKKDIFPTQMVKFEDLELPIPNRPEGLLKPHYGENYMQPVPEKDRKPSHTKFVSLISSCPERNKFHFAYQNLIMLFSLISLMLVVGALLIFDEVSFFMAGLAIILVGIVLMLFINKKS